MKILHIGKMGNMERFTLADEYTDSLEKVCLPMGLPTKEYLEKSGDADVIIADAVATVDRELIEGMSRLKLIHSEGVAYNRIDIEAASERGIPVCNCAAMNATAVAEQTILLMLGVIKNVVNNNNAVRNGRQIEIKEAYMAGANLYELADFKIGLIGLGDIGKSTARLLNAFGCKVFYYKRNRLSEAEEAELNVFFKPMAELISQCDIVSLHLPVTPDTAGMCNDEFFGKMKMGSYFINTSRGELVDSEALIRALRSGRVKMAGLDTLDNEPVQPEHVLLNAEDIVDKILFSPHIGGITASSFRRGYRIIWRNIRAVSEGLSVKSVNLDAK